MTVYLPITLPDRRRKNYSNVRNGTLTDPAARVARAVGVAGWDGALRRPYHYAFCVKDLAKQRK